MKKTNKGQPPGRAIACIGLGNIGSQFVGLAAFIPGVSRMVLVDRDVYEEANLATQRITRRDLGQPKALAQARWLREVNPSLDVLPIVSDLADLPFGRLRGCAVIVAGLDSLESRLLANQAAWRLGIPWLDGAIDPERRLVRVNGYRPGPEGSCFECALHGNDYEALAAVHPCDAADAGAVAPTNGPASLGAIAAALLVEECRKILEGAFADSLVDRQVLLDLVHHRQCVTNFRRNPRCRFDHGVWRPEPLAGIRQKDTLGQLLAVAARAAGAGPDPEIRLEGRQLVRGFHCARCGQGAGRLRAIGRGRPVSGRCPSCGALALRVAACDSCGAIDARFPAEYLGASLRKIGFVRGDVITVGGNRGERRFVLFAQSRPRKACPEA